MLAISVQNESAIAISDASDSEAFTHISHKKRRRVVKRKDFVNRTAKIIVLIFKRQRNLFKRVELMHLTLL
jgi:hypothetical protein